MNSTNSQVKSNELWQLSYHCKKDTTMFHSLSYDATFDSGYMVWTWWLSESRFFDQFFGFLKLLVQVKNQFLDLLFFRGMAGQSWVHIPAAALYLPVLSLQKRATAPPHWFELWTISASTLTAFWGLSWLLSCKQHLIRCFAD